MFENTTYILQVLCSKPFEKTHPHQICEPPTGQLLCIDIVKENNACVLGCMYLYVLMSNSIKRKHRLDCVCLGLCRDN
jgi:hypothetical protein